MDAIISGFDLRHLFHVIPDLIGDPVALKGGDGFPIELGMTGINLQYYTILCYIICGFSELRRKVGIDE